MIAYWFLVIFEVPWGVTIFKNFDECLDFYTSENSVLRSWDICERKLNLNANYSNICVCTEGKNRIRKVSNVNLLHR